MRARPHALFESLEPRRLLANFNWDGGGDGTSWEDASNWEGDVLPGPLDHVVINRIGSNPTIVFSSGDVNIYNLRCEENLTITGGRLVVFETNWMAGTLTVNGGTLLVGIEWQQLGPVSLSAGAIDGVAAFVLKNTMDWTGGSLGQDSAPSGRFHITPSGTLNIHGDVNLDRVLVNNGTLNWTSGVLAIERGQLLNMAGRTIDVFAGASIAAASSAAGLIVNRGTINFQGDAEIGARYHQVSGGITTSAGTITLRRGGYIDGTFTVAPGMELRCAGDSASVALNILPDADLTLGGALSLTGGRMAIKSAGVTLDTLTFSGRSLTLAQDTAIGTLVWSAGVLGGNGQVNITQIATWSGGTLVGAADFVIDTGAELLIPDGTAAVRSSRPIVIFGTMTWEDGDITVTEELVIDGGGALHASAPGTFILDGDGGLTVRGEFIAGGSGTTLFRTLSGAGGLIVENGATVQSGLVSVEGNSSLAGLFTIEEDATLGLAGNAGDVLVDPTAVFTGAGTLLILPAFFSASVELRGTVETARFIIQGIVDLDDITLNAGVTELASGGFIIGSDDLVLSESFVWSGGGFGGTGRTIVPVGATATLDTGGVYRIEREFVNRGTISVSRGFLHVIGGGGVFTNEAGSVFELLKDTSGVGPYITVENGARFELLEGAVLDTTGGLIEARPGSVVNLDGTVNKTGTETLSFIAGDDEGHADGVFNIIGGMLSIGQGIHSGEFHLSAGTTMKTFDGAAADPVFTPESSITGAGTLGNEFGGVEFQGVVDVGRLRIVHAQGVTGTVALLMEGTKRAGTVELVGDTLLIGAATTLDVTGAFQHTAGRLQMRVGGTSPSLYSHITVGGALSLAGGPPVALEIIYWGGFTPAVGQSYDLITSETRSGQFGTVVLPVQPAGAIADLDYLPGLIRLNIVSA